VKACENKILRGLSDLKMYEEEMRGPTQVYFSG
jgi:hypothetical protein